MNIKDTASPAKTKEVSIKDVARLANVSVPTVSRVLNNAGKYSKETEQRVRQVIAECGYQPSMLAKGLRKSISQSIGVLVPDITNEFFAAIALAIQKTLFAHSYATVICNTNEQASMQEKQLEQLRSSRVAGIIFISGEDIEDKALLDGMPKVFVDRIPWNAEAKDVVTVTADNFEGGRIAANTMLEAGCKRIAAIFDARGLNTQVARYAGFLRAHRDQCVDFDHVLYRTVSEISYEQGYKTVKRMLAEGLDFDGVFCYTDTLACGAVRALHEAGKFVPQQVMVVGFDDTSASRWCMPTLTTVAQPVEEMGRLAAELILQMAQDMTPKQKNYILPVKMICRESTAVKR